ncbi:DNA polymerase [Alphaproteobacteria phage PhiJL001]|uniref:DNA-directed DNA polymerase n=1 Tax=Alphaproteobacteria phage PhiJL001 TaxID=2681607 RepID=Q5DN77_9CAUD|nr:DNA polymerase [Alphaproteobacteria phage PhiJL001]AAT69504.1 DNA polymerase [Alphaproteobacteria phage PhiJL001]
MQLPMFAPESSWQPPDMSTLPSWKGARRVAFDLETYDPHLKDTGPSVRTGGHIAGYGFAIDGGPKHYLPVRHENGDNLDAAQVLRYIKDQFKTFDGELVGANLGYDLDWAWAEGIDMPLVKAYRDVLIAEPCINENKFFYSLDSVAGDWLGEQKSKTLMIEAARAYGMRKDSELGSYIHLLPARYVGVYGEDDCALPLRILELQEKEIEQQGIQAVWDLESKVLPVLVRMRQRGVKVDEDRLMEVEIRATKERRDASDLITRVTGVAVGPEDAMKKGILVDALRAAGHQLNADDAVDKHFIARHEGHCEVTAALGRLRKWDTLRKLAIDPVKNHMVNGRIHCSFNQMAADKDNGKGTKGARYGRLSCEHVNMQQQPSRDEDIAPIWRRIYRPDDGGLWAALDYSQQEPRMLVHFAEICGMPGASEAAQKYRDDPDTDNHQMMADMAGISRKEAKIIFLGLCYGMGQEKLCHDLQLPTKIIELKKGPRKGQKMVVAGDEGARLFETFHAKVPFVKQMENLCKDRATERGFITTLLGRRCRFKMGDDGLNYWGTHKALNRLIQGSSADQTKAAMVAADEAGYELQLQVHDEIDLTVESREQAEKIAEIMRTCVEINVPSKVDVEVGVSWGEAA